MTGLGRKPRPSRPRSEERALFERRQGFPEPDVFRFQLHGLEEILPGRLFASELLQGQGTVEVHQRVSALGVKEGLVVVGHGLREALQADEEVAPVNQSVNEPGAELDYGRIGQISCFQRCLCREVAMR